MPASSKAEVADRGPAIIALFWVEGSVAILVLALRFYGRSISSVLGKDDYAMLITVIIFIILCGFTTFLAKNGGFRHLADLSEAEKVIAVKYNWITQEWGISGLVAGKVSVALQLLRIIGTNNKRNRWTLYLLMASLVAISVVDCIITFAQCSPPEALWDPNIPHKCWGTEVQTDYALFVGSWNVVADLILALLPLGTVLNLNLSLRKRLSTVALLGLGVVAAAFGIVKVTCLGTLTARSDLTWETYPLYVWTGLEFWMIIVCGSIPPMRPVFTRIFRGHKKSLFSGYYDFSSSTGDPKSPRGHFSTTRHSRSQEIDTEALRPSAITAENDGNLGHRFSNAENQIVRMIDIRVETQRAG